MTQDEVLSDIMEDVMLVLTRKLGETIQIGDSIVVEVAAIKGNRVRIAIKAPDDVDIRRGELDAKMLTPVKAVVSGRASLPLVTHLQMG